MVLVKSVIKSILHWLITIPQLNIKIQYILRPINKHKEAISTLLKNISYSRILDYGCGEGFFSDCFSQPKYYGYDPVVKKIEYAKKRFVHYEFLLKIPELSMFDLFFFNNLLHHINPEQVNTLINEISESAKRNSHILILELKPRYQQTSYIYKLLLLVESKIHYSKPRPMNFYKQVMQNNGFALIDEKDLGAFYLLLFMK